LTAAASALARAGHGQGVGLGLFDDADADHRHPVAAQHVAALHRACFHAGHVAQTHQVAVCAACQDEVFEVLHAPEPALDAHPEIPCQGLDVAGRQLDVLHAQGVFHIGDGQVAGGELIAVDPDAHRILQPAAEPDPGDPVEGRKAVDKVAAGVVGELHDRHAVACQVEPDDDVGICVGLLDFGRVGLGRKAAENPGDTVADIIGGGVACGQNLLLGEGHDQVALAHDLVVFEVHGCDTFGDRRGECGRLVGKYGAKGLDAVMHGAHHDRRRRNRRGGFCALSHGRRRREPETCQQNRARSNEYRQQYCKGWVVTSL
jgi:hypothetical protein